MFRKLSFSQIMFLFVLLISSSCSNSDSLAYSRGDSKLKEKKYKEALLEFKVDRENNTTVCSCHGKIPSWMGLDKQAYCLMMSSSDKEDLLDALDYCDTCIIMSKLHGRALDLPFYVRSLINEKLGNIHQSQIDMILSKNLALQNKRDKNFFKTVYP